MEKWQLIFYPLWVLSVVLLFCGIDHVKKLRRRYVVQWSTSGAVFWRSADAHWMLGKAIESCDEAAQLHKNLRHRIFDRQTRKEAYEYGKHRWAGRRVRGNSRRGFTRCISCGADITSRRYAVCRPCFARSGKRTRSGVASMLYLFGEPLHSHQIRGRDCTCVETDRVHMEFNYMYRAMSNGYELTANVTCLHYRLVNVLVAICPEHRTLDFRGTPTCCEELAAIKPRTGARRGWRIYRVYRSRKGVYLRAIFAKHEYTPGVNISPGYKRGMKYFAEAHPAGGFYVFSHLAFIQAQEEGVWREVNNGAIAHPHPVWLSTTGEPDFVGWAIGSVICFGGVKDAQWGWRCEKLIPESIVLSGTGHEYDFLMLEIADRYKLKLITFKQAAEMPTDWIEFSKDQLREMQSRTDD